MGRLLSTQFLKKHQKKFISKPVHMTSLTIFISLWGESISQYLLHAFDLWIPTLTPPLGGADKLVEQGQPPPHWFSMFVKLGTQRLISCPFYASLKHCHSQLLNHWWQHISSAGGYTIQWYRLSREVPNQESNILSHLCLPWWEPLISAPEQLCLSLTQNWDHTEHCKRQLCPSFSDTINSMNK